VIDEITITPRSAVDSASINPRAEDENRNAWMNWGEQDG
jgi:hypothetical protein